MKSGPDSPAFEIVRAAALIGTIILFFWIGIAIRHWFVLSKWTKSTSSTNSDRKRVMKNWIMIMTMTKKIRVKKITEYILHLLQKKTKSERLDSLMTR
ncbi:MAG TPA: hypothetical protein VE264_02030 [Nitrososphaera sp.]|nr:hypothetical protein [Nitrososphaera sp.]